jgi:hypothetical protein
MPRKKSRPANAPVSPPPRKKRPPLDLEEIDYRAFLLIRALDEAHPDATTEELVLLAFPK